MNLGELRTSTNRRSGVSYAQGALDDAINEALLSIDLEWPWPWRGATQTYAVPSTSTPADPYIIATPFDASHVTSVSVGDTLYTAVGIADIDNASRGNAFAIHGGSIYLSPIAGDTPTLTIRYTLSETPLSIAEQTPLLPAQYHLPVLVPRAAAIVLERLGHDPSRIASMMASYTHGLRRMMGDSRVNPHSARIRPGSAF